MTLHGIEDTGLAKRNARPGGAALFALGFRPFYLMAAAFAAVGIPLWLAAYYGRIDAARIDLAWHAHEMVFGFVVAVVIGFLYTAGRNWTGLWTPRGKALAAIAALWLAGRIAMLAAAPLLAAAVDASFIPVAAWPLYRVLKRSGNKRNMLLVGLLALLAAIDAAFHAATLGWLAVAPLQAVHAAIMVIVIIETVIGGRIIPNFTANAIKGVKPVMNERRDRIALGFTALAGIAWALSLPAPFAAALALAAAVAQAARLAGWKPWVAARNPLLWILHVSYAWIPFGFLLLALADIGGVPLSAAVHVLAIGALAGLIVGMITRTALGHTGRPLQAGRAETAMYVLVQGSVLARFLAAVDAAGWRDAMLLATGICWSLVFVVYLFTYGPYLCKPRLDGRPG